MSRWHERGCRHPEVALVDDIPYCTDCFALASLEDQYDPFSQETPSSYQERASRALHWPPDIPSTNSSAQLDKVTEPNRKVQRRDSDSTSIITPKIPELYFEDEILLAHLVGSYDQDGPIHLNLEIARLRNFPLPEYDILSYASTNSPQNFKPIFIGPF